MYSLVRNLLQQPATVRNCLQCIESVSPIKCIWHGEFAESVFRMISQDAFQRGRCSLLCTSCLQMLCLFASQGRRSDFLLSFLLCCRLFFFRGKCSSIWMYLVEILCCGAAVARSIQLFVAVP